jgi:uncharacterized iron-regulated protein
MRHRAGVVALVLGLVVASAATAVDSLPPWRTTASRDHPLVGRIWDVDAGLFVPPAALPGRLTRFRFVLLGEKHDNADHHRLQAWVLAELVAAGRRPNVAFEMLTTAQAPAVDRYLASNQRSAAGLGDAVEWGRSGWPDWRLYQPIADVALRASLRIVATNLPESTMAAVRRSGVTALDPTLVARYELDRPLSAQDYAAMAQEIRAAHCGHASDATVVTLVNAQRSRDAHMADRLAAASEPDGAVLIAGAGHVRIDRGVPAALRLARPGASVLTLAFLEVERDVTNPADYAAGFGVPTLPFQYVWFTPRVDDVDPCEKFKESLERLREKR